MNIEILKNVIKYNINYDLLEGILKGTADTKLSKIIDLKTAEQQADELYKIFGITNANHKKDVEFAEGLEKEGKKDPKELIIKRGKPQDNQYQGIFVENYIKNVEHFHSQNPFFYDRSNIFWLWDKQEYKYKIIDETDIMILLEKEFKFYGQTVTARIKSQYIESFKRVGRINLPKDAPVEWIQFKNTVYDLKTGKTHEATPNYFFTNPIAWEIGESTETPIMDKLFAEWVGEEYVQTLYEICAYCTYRTYPIQALFCLFGSGRNGKSSFLKIVSNFIGADNIGSTELDLLIGRGSSRFESFKLYKKLMCLMGETNFGFMEQSSLLKKLTGGDLIGFEMKGKNPFDSYNYAKMIIASNSLPTSQDTSDGFYRRWVIIDFPNQFKEGKDICLKVPDKEYKNLALKVTKILPGILERGYLTNQGDIKSRRLKYIMASNPIPMFLDECCEKGFDYFVEYNELYAAYVKYLIFHKKRKVSRKEFKSALEDEGYWVEKATKKISDFGDGQYKATWWIEGLKLKNNWDLSLNNDKKKEVYDNYDNYDKVCNSESYIGFLRYEPSHKSHKSHNFKEISEKSLVKTKNIKNIRNYLKSLIKAIPIDNAVLLDEHFSQEVELMLKNGEIYENPKGTYKINE